MIEIQVADCRWTFRELPNSCPRCHHAISPIIVEGVVVEERAFGRVRIDLFFQCPQKECRRGFVGHYGADARPGMTTIMELRSTAPHSPAPPALQPKIAEVSPSFATIYQQAHAAEAFRLAEVAGCGYRKALEFLVKDYCVLLDPDAAEQIRREPLGSVIDTRVPEASIRECARRAAWLGNDETHYVRRWNEHDINDLKRLLTLTMGWISASLLTREYLDGMPGKS